MTKIRNNPDGSGFNVLGKITRRILSGEIAAGRVHRIPDPPNPKSVSKGAGYGLGKGATRARGGDETR